MADYSCVTKAQEFELQFERMLLHMRFILPGIVTAFSTDKKRPRCSILPATKLKVTLGEKVDYYAYPELHDIPIIVPCVPGVGLLTLPIKKGTKGILFFNDRSLEEFLQTGRPGLPDPPGWDYTIQPRQHSLNDGVFLPGLITNVDTVPDWHPDNIELRDYKRQHYLSIGADGITISDGQAKWNMSEGRVTMEAPSGIEQTDGAATWGLSGGASSLSSSNATISTAGITTAGNVVAAGNVAAAGDVTVGAVSLSAHVHTNVTPGSNEQVSGPPLTPGG
jgi:phage baseplate assembly protein gpV